MLPFSLVAEARSTRPLHPVLVSTLSFVCRCAREGSARDSRLLPAGCDPSRPAPSPASSCRPRSPSAAVQAHLDGLRALGSPVGHHDQVLDRLQGGFQTPATKRTALADQGGEQYLGRGCILGRFRIIPPLRR